MRKLILLSLLTSASAWGITCGNLAGSVNCIQYDHIADQSGSSLTSITKAFPSTPGAHHLLIAHVSYYNVTSVSSTITVTGGGQTWLPVTQGNQSQFGIQTFYAQDSLAAATTVTATFNLAGGVTYPNLIILEYSGIANTSALDVFANNAGTSSLSNSGSATATAQDLVFAGVFSTTQVTGAGVGFTIRVQNDGTSSDGAEDQIANASTVVAGTFPLAASGLWISQLVAFKVASPFPYTPGTGTIFNVKTYGATGNGSTDDTSAINSAISAAGGSGNTVYFPGPGTYKITSTVTLHNNLVMQCDNGAIVSANVNSQGFSMQTDYPANNVTFSGCIFDGAGVYLRGDNSAFANNVTFYDNTVRNIHLTDNQCVNFPPHNGVYTGVIQNSTIKGNHFDSIYYPPSMTDTDTDYCANGLLINGGAINTLVQRNTFNNIYQAITADYTAGGNYPGTIDYVGVVFDGNVCSQIHRMCMEMQGNGLDGLVLKNNYMSNWQVPWYNSFGISLAANTKPGAPGHTISHNTLIMYPPATAASSQGPRYGIGIELEGDHDFTQYNRIYGQWPGCCGGFSVAVGVASFVTVTNNYICGWTNGTLSGGVNFESGPQTSPTISPNTAPTTCAGFSYSPAGSN